MDFIADNFRWLFLFSFPTAIGIIVFSSGVISVSISMVGMWYAIIKHRMMSISPEFVSEYIYKAVNEPIIISMRILL